jgi:hypothetical protein
VVRLTYTLRASGDAFSPTDAEARCGHPFTEKHERGETATTGRYRGRALPYGWAELRSAEEASGGPNSPFVHAAEALAAASAVSGATECTLHIDVAFRDQCNLELSRETIATLAKLGLPVTVSCFPEEA